MTSGKTVPVLSASGIYKSFRHVQALRGAEISVYPGEVAALIGDNGSGKSTLVKILSGTIKPDSGMITVGGRTFSALSPKEAVAAGLATVYQDLSLDDYRDVPANIFLGNELTYCGLFLRRAEMRRRSLDLLRKIKIDIPAPLLPVGVFSGGQRQAVAVARAVYYGKKMVLFDEPTAAMGGRESAAVLNIIRTLADEGLAVLIVSHNLHQVFSISDRISIMRRGRVISSIRTAETSIADVQHILEEADNLE